jgi:hypothetical protein
LELIIGFGHIIFFYFCHHFNELSPLCFFGSRVSAFAAMCVCCHPQPLFDFLQTRKNFRIFVKPTPSSRDLFWMQAWVIMTVATLAAWPGMPTPDTIDSPEMKEILYHQLGGDVREFESFISRVSGSAQIPEVMQEQEQAHDQAAVTVDADTDFAEENMLREIGEPTLGPATADFAGDHIPSWAKHVSPASTTPTTRFSNKFSPHEGFKHTHGLLSQSRAVINASPSHDGGIRAAHHHHRGNRRGLGTRPAETASGDQPSDDKEPALDTKEDEIDPTSASLSKQIENRLNKNFVKVKEMSSADAATHVAW